MAVVRSYTYVGSSQNRKPIGNRFWNSDLEPDDDEGLPLNGPNVIVKIAGIRWMERSVQDRSPWRYLERPMSNSRLLLSDDDDETNFHLIF